MLVARGGQVPANPRWRISACAARGVSEAEASGIGESTLVARIGWRQGWAALFPWLWKSDCLQQSGQWFSGAEHPARTSGIVRPATHVDGRGGSRSRSRSRKERRASQPFSRAPDPVCMQFLLSARPITCLVRGGSGHVQAWAGHNRALR